MFKNDIDIHKDFLNDKDFKSIQDWISIKENFKSHSKRYRLNLDKIIVKKEKVLNNLFLKIRDFLNINDSFNYEIEWWINYNSHQDWHIDKDEEIYEKCKEVYPAKRSLIFYVKNPQKGGDLEIIKKDEILNKIQKIKIPFQINQLVSFSSKMPHRISNYEGQRITIAINLWRIKT